MPRWPIFTSSRASPVETPIRVSTLQADLDFAIGASLLGSQLFDLVANALGLREVWYFDLSFVHSTGAVQWVPRDKKVLSLAASRASATSSRLLFRFGVKFYPLRVERELIQGITRHFFFLQVKERVLDGSILTAPESAILLASYAVQAKYGDYDPAMHPPGFLGTEPLLPAAITRQFQMTPFMWQERVIACFADHQGMLHDEAELEYLTVVQGLGMYGVAYIDVTSRAGAPLLLGIGAAALHIYRPVDRLSPLASFAWGDIRDIFYSGNKFTIRPRLASMAKYVFYTADRAANKSLLQWCLGCHELHVQRKRPESLEKQQMRSVAAMEQVRKEMLQQRIIAQRGATEAMTRERDELMRERDQLRDSLQLQQTAAESLHRALQRSEAAVTLMSEKADAMDLESSLVLRKLTDTEAQLAACRIELTEITAEKITLAARVRQTQDTVAAMTVEARAIQAELIDLRLQRGAVKPAADPLPSGERRREAAPPIAPKPRAGSPLRGIGTAPLSKSPAVHLPLDLDAATPSVAVDAQEKTAASVDDTSALRASLQAEQAAFSAKSTSLQSQLRSLKAELEADSAEALEHSIGLSPRNHSTLNRRGLLTTQASNAQIGAVAEATPRVAFAAEF